MERKAAGESVMRGGGGPERAARVYYNSPLAKFRHFLGGCVTGCRIPRFAKKFAQESEGVKVALQ